MAFLFLTSFCLLPSIMYIVILFIMQGKGLVYYIDNFLTGVYLDASPQHVFWGIYRIYTTVSGCRL